MAKFFTNFQSDPLNAEPAGFTVLNGPHANWLVIDSGGGDKQLLFDPVENSSNYGVLKIGDVESLNQQVFFSANNEDFESGSTRGRFNALLRVSGTFSSASFYNVSVGRISGVNTLSIRKQEGFNFTNAFRNLRGRAGSSLTMSAVSSTDYVNLRADVEVNGTGATVRAKYWLNDTDEPIPWDLEWADSASLPSGHSYFTIENLLEDVKVSGIGQGTNGETAPSAPVATGPNTPINPSITSLLATSARLNWDQG